MSEMEPRRRRSWTTEEKWRLVEEARLPGNAVAEVARRHGVNNNQLFGWIRAAEAGQLGPRPAPLILVPKASTHNEFIPIGVFGTCDDEGPAITMPALRPPDTSPVESSAQSRADRSTRTSTLEERPGVIEIDLPGGARVRVDAFVNERALRRVLAALGAKS
ncbi:transposase [Microvirga sp. VF16]|uniref:IS66-like element accessory protein TnpA n=1 Tax=Microvirga sp. VF16 TaxID=2807101 RepID=UPI00193DDCA2|nr:transposase [Microvirga sp. VF16]QRM33599.1 transposase [Microvirga sp. VF16]QRM34408.1 transposase [Microvirga sp. VF16]